jgi:ribose/xylose/arabinose/galactoside ABC-type transport system permease subunit
MIRSFFKKQDNFTLLGMVVTLVLLSFIFGISSQYFFLPKNLLNIGQSISIRGIIAIGLTAVLITGGLDLSIAAVSAVAGMVAAAILKANGSGVQAVLAALAAAAVLGAINGLIIVRFRINPIIATLGSLLLFRGLAYVVSGGDNIVIGTYAWSYLGRGYFWGIPVSLILFLVLIFLAWLFMKYTIIGNYLYAIGGNSTACRNAGIPVDLIRFGTYVATAMLSGTAGLILMSQAGTAMPIAMNGAELDIIAAVLLGGIGLSGGRGTMIGTLLGIVIIGVVNNGLILAGVQIYWQMVARGLILIIAVTLDSFRKGGGYR